MRIVITEFMDAAAVAALQARFSVHHDPQLAERRAETLESVADADALIVRNRTRVDRALIAAAPKLRVVGRLGVGLDNIDVEACRARAVEVIPAAGANSQSVAEYVIAAAMLLLRGAFGSSAAVAAGDWPRQALSDGREISGKTLGVVGFGGIGRLVARHARALGMRVLAHDALLPADAKVFRDLEARPMALEALLHEADVVSLHLPLDDSTRNLIGAGRLRAMKSGAVLINTARGGIVDEAALAQALREGHLAGAALDVFEREPLAAGSPLAGVPNLIMTPHIAGLTRESNERVSAMIAARVAAALGG
ncbi:MAG: hydroxyacid dehydrogenase [Burkholderiales bacterium]